MDINFYKGHVYLLYTRLYTNFPNPSVQPTSPTQNPWNEKFFDVLYHRQEYLKYVRALITLAAVGLLALTPAKSSGILCFILPPLDLQHVTTVVGKIAYWFALVKLPTTLPVSVVTRRSAYFKAWDQFKIGHHHVCLLTSVCGTCRSCLE